MLENSDTTFQERQHLNDIPEESGSSDVADVVGVGGRRRPGAGRRAGAVYRHVGQRRRQRLLALGDGVRGLQFGGAGVRRRRFVERLLEVLREEVIIQDDQDAVGNINAPLEHLRTIGHKSTWGKRKDKSWEVKKTPPREVSLRTSSQN